MNKIKLFNVDQKLSFHECKICGIEVEEGKVIIILAEKYIYSQTQEYNRIVVAVDNLTVGEEYVSLTISSVNRKGKVRELTVNKLKDLLLANNLTVYLDYYSKFSKSLLIKGTLKSMEMEITISEIDSISLFNDNSEICSFEM